MQNLKGKIAVVTGAASGIGEGMAMAFAAAGMDVVIADIETAKAAAVAERVSKLGVRSLAVHCDVSDSDSVSRLADTSFEEFGAVQLLCNNAGVLLMGPQAEMIVKDWNWLFAVNVMGVAHGLEAFLPRMREQGGPAHIVNTGSVAGLRGTRGTFIYGATKAAVLAMSEALRQELEDTEIGVSVVLPSDIRSNIVGSQRNRPADAGREHKPPFPPELAAKYGLDPMDVGVRVREAVERDEFYVFTLPEKSAAGLRTSIDARSKELLAALEAGVLTGDLAP